MGYCNFNEEMTKRIMLPRRHGMMALHKAILNCLGIVDYNPIQSGGAGEGSCRLGANGSQQNQFVVYEIFDNPEYCKVTIGYDVHTEKFLDSSNNPGRYSLDRRGFRKYKFAGENKYTADVFIDPFKRRKFDIFQYTEDPWELDYQI